MTPQRRELVWFLLASFQDFFANHTDWIITKPVRIILVLIAAFILARLVRRATRKLAERIARRASSEPAEDPVQAHLAFGRFQTPICSARRVEPRDPHYARMVSLRRAPLGTKGESGQQT